MQKRLKMAVLKMAVLEYLKSDKQLYQDILLFKVAMSYFQLDLYHCILLLKHILTVAHGALLFLHQGEICGDLCFQR